MSDHDQLRALIMQELKDLQRHQNNIQDDFILSQVEVDYLHFLDMFIKQYPKEQIMAVLNELYEENIITAIRNPQGLLFDIKLVSAL